MPETIVKKLPKAIQFGHEVATDIEMREPTVSDLMEAEKEANPGLQPHAYSAALAARVTLRAGNYTGPFAPGHFHKMGARTWYAVREALQEAEALGEGEQPETAPGA